MSSILLSINIQGEHEALREIKNEFMALWDGLRSAESYNTDQV